MHDLTFLKEFDYSVLDDSDYKEDAVREDIITPILRLLGYKNSDPYKIIRTKKLNHPFVYIGSTSNKITIEPDYQLSLNGKIKCIIEAKSPQINISEKKALQQAYSYAIHPEIRATYYTICNGRHIKIFDVGKIESIFLCEIRELSDPLIWKKLYNIISVQALTKLETLNFKPDYGLTLKKIGEDEDIPIYFHDEPIFHITRVDDVTFTFMNEREHGGVIYAISFDIPADIFLQIINSLPKERASKIIEKLTKQPYSTDIEPPLYITFQSKLGTLEINNNEEYIPLQLTELQSISF